MAVLSVHIIVWLPANSVNTCAPPLSNWRGSGGEVRFLLAKKDGIMSFTQYHIQSGNFCADAAGYLNNTNGLLNNRGTNGYYWSSSQNSSTNGWNLNFNSGNSNMNNNNKAYGFSVRCLRDSEKTAISPVFFKKNGAFLMASDFSKVSNFGKVFKNKL